MRASLVYEWFPSLHFARRVALFVKYLARHLFDRCAPGPMRRLTEVPRIMRWQVRAERRCGSTVFVQRPIPWPRSWLRLIVGGGVVRVGVVLLVVRGVVRTGGGVRWCW